MDYNFSGHNIFKYLDEGSMYLVRSATKNNSKLLFSRKNRSIVQ